MTPQERAAHFATIRKGLLRDAPKVYCPDDTRLLAAAVTFEKDRYLWTLGGRAGELAERRSERRAAPEMARAGLAEIEEHHEVWREQFGEDAYGQMLDQARADVGRAERLADLTEHPSDQQRWPPQAVLLLPGDHRTVATACPKCRRLRVVDYDTRSDTLGLLTPS